MNIVNPKELRIIHGLPSVAKKGDRIAIDTEFFGMNKKRLHRPHGKFAYMGASFDGRTVYYIDDEEEIEEFLKRLELGVWILAHAKFDIMQLRRYANIPMRKNLWDVILIEQVQYSGFHTEFGLSDLVRRYLDTYMPKEERSTFSDTESLSQDQINYSSADVAYTWRVAKVQKEKISPEDLAIYRDIELPFLWTLLGMSGVRLDVDKWTVLAVKNAKIALDIQDKYGYSETIEGPRGGKKETFHGINLNSPAQVKKHLQECGWHVKSTDADALEEMLLQNSEDEDDAGYRFANDLMVYRTYQKRASTYGLSFLEDVEEDGKIYADVYQIGAETGRTSCRRPNLQNQPHLPEYRECFICDPDEVMIVADWGAQEPRFAAFFSDDDGLKEALNNEEKLYIRIARDALGINIDKKSDEYSHMKSTILGIFYGMSAKGLAARIEVEEDVAEGYIEVILDTYPGVKEYIRRQKRAKDYVTSVSGRKIWLNKYNYQWERNALNAPIQGSAADAMKIASYRFCMAWMKEFGDYEENEVPMFYQNTPLTLLVHDEIVIKVPKALKDHAKKLLEHVMISVAEELHVGIKGSVEIFDGENWACKH